MKSLRATLVLMALVVGVHAEDPKEPVKPPIKPEIVKVEAFKQRYQRVGMAETMHHTEFVGVRDGVAILRVGDMNPLTQGWREKWIGVKLVDLDPEFRAVVEKEAAVIDARLKAEQEAKEKAAQKAGR